MKLKGFKVIDAINIVGFRTRAPSVNKFCDTISVYRKFPSGWEGLHWPATTRPGLPMLLRPVNPKGTAIMVPGQYEDAYALGAYKGYQALRQVGPIRVYRDKNQDSHFDYDSANIEQGLFGVHIHRAGVFSSLVGTWSAGCQVFQKRRHFEEFISICQWSAAAVKNRFSYTLLEI